MRQYGRYGYGVRDVVLVIGTAVVCIGLLVGLAYALYVAHAREARCEAAGGHEESYNCSTIIMPISCGKGCTMLVPMESCDHRCVGARPEAP